MKFLIKKSKYKIVKRFAWFPTIVRQNRSRTKQIKYWFRSYYAIYIYCCNSWKKTDFNTYYIEGKYMTNVWQEIHVSNQLKKCQRLIETSLPYVQGWIHI
jgi:hypothetical protein